MTTKLTSVARKNRFETLDGRIRKSSVQLGQDLLEIKENELWREGNFKGWKDYCDSINRSLQQAWQLTEAAKVQKSFPDVKIPNESTAREIKKIALPQRRQVVDKALGETGGKLTASAVKNAAKSLPEKRSAAKLPKDSTGMDIPPEIQLFWNRNEEVQFLLSMISKIRTTLEKADETNDPLYSMIDRQGCISRLKMTYEEISSAKSYAVCPKCNGIFFSDCPDCRKRGTLSKFHWDRVSEDIKKLRE